MSTQPTVSNFSIVQDRRNKAYDLFQEKLVFSYNGGMFRATTEQLTMAELFRDTERSFILLDINRNPIEIIDVEDFLDEFRETYYEASQFYAKEIAEIKKIRKPEVHFNG